MSDTPTEAYEPIFTDRVKKIADLLVKLTNLANAAIVERELGDPDKHWVQGSFRALLNRSIRLVDTSQEDDPTSIGLEWVATNTTKFNQLFAHEGRSTFFGAHLANLSIVAMVGDARLFRLIPEDERALFASKVLDRWIPATNTWLRVLAENQVDKSVAANAIRNWLASAHHIEGGEAFRIRFLQEGAGIALWRPPIDRLFPARWELPDGTEFPTLWATLTDTQLRLVLLMCANLIPQVFFGEPPVPDDAPVAQKVRLRLPKADASRVLDQAAAHLNSAEGLSIEALSWLGSNSRYRLAERLRGISLPFLVWLSIDVPGGLALFTRYAARTISTDNVINEIIAAHQVIKRFENCGNLDEHQLRVITRLSNDLSLLAARHYVATGQMNFDDTVCLSNDRGDTLYTDSGAALLGLKAGDHVIFRIPETGTQTTFYKF